MQNYKYTAINIQKKKFTGIFAAENEKDLASQLAQQNLFLISATPYSGKTPSSFFTLGTGKVSIGELTTFCRQFSIMINSGISILECLEALKNQAFSTFFKNVLQVIYEDVKSGIVLSEALNKHSNIFPDFFRSMIYVGEASGKLDMVLDSLADYYERDSAIRRKTKSAFSYPIFLFCLIIAIVVLMLVFIIPTFKNTLSDLSVTPTGFTKFIYDASDFLVTNWLNMLAVISVVGLAIFVFSRTEVGKYFFDTLALKIPLIKKVSISLISARFARAFGLLLASGMDMASSLKAVSIVLGNKEFEKRFAAATEDVNHGMALAMAFENYNLFPSIMLQMIAVGERTAALDDILNRSCAFFDEQTETTLNSVTSKIQPVLLLILGTVIAVLFIAVYSPIISIMTSM